MSYLLTATDLQARLSSIGYTLRVDDDPSSVAQVLQRATNKVKYYTEPLYDADAIQANANASGWVNDRAVDVGAYYLCTRRGNDAPKSVLEEYKEAIVSLEEIRNDDGQIPNVAQRHKSSPTFSNVRIDPNYLIAKVRVESPISESSPRIGYSAYNDWATLGVIEF